LAEASTAPEPIGNFALRNVGYRNRGALVLK
jgi:hypothetical protein